ncbi:MAG: TonB-dependent receptor, partial [Comamonadaceae bacterium]
ANRVRVPAWTVVDLGARYATRLGGTPVTLRAGLENVFNKRYWRQGTYATLGMPRTFVVSTSFDF